jgi:hypothetical protein
VEPPGIDDFVRCKRTAGGGRFDLEHGVLEQPKDDTQVYWLRDNRRITLRGFRQSDLRTTLVTTGIRFYPFRGAYLMAEQGFQGKPSTVWWLYPDGRTERVEMPVGPWDKQGRINSSFAASRAGILVHLPVPMNWSLYAVQSKRIVELVKGAVMRYSVSPDGCKVAYLHQELKPASAKRTERIPVLKALNVCAKAPR